MAIDLTGGIDPAREHVFAHRPEDPEMRDSVSMWVFADDGEVGLTRIGVEAVAANWEHHGLQVNVAFPDGRVYRLRDDGEAWPPPGADGAPSVLGAGPLGFRCVQPFRTWVMTFDGSAVETSTFDLADGKIDGPLVDVRFEVEATMAVAPVGPGNARAGGGRAARDVSRPTSWAATGTSSCFAAPARYRSAAKPSTRSREPACASAARGSAASTEFRGHCWQSALFPSGKAFGYIAYPPRDDGQPTFNEGYRLRRVTARSSRPGPSRRRGSPRSNRFDEDVSVVLETGRGTDSDRGRDGAFDLRHPPRRQDVLRPTP